MVAPEVEARQLFVEAVTAIQDGRHNDAIVLLERARALHEVPAVVYNLGLAHRGAGHYVEAAQTLERYVALAARRLDDARRVEVERLIAEARSRTALVTVTVVGTGVLVTMDGEPAPSELLRAPTRINPGRHVLRATAPGHRPHEVVREIGSGENVRIELAPERENVVTAIRIGSSVADADVLIDRIVVAAGSYESRIRPGRHEIEVRARGYQPFETVVVVMPGQFVQLQARLVQRVPWTGHWWIWAGMALPPLAGAAVLTGVMLSDTEPPTNTTTMTNLGVP